MMESNVSCDHKRFEIHDIDDTMYPAGLETFQIGHAICLDCEKRCRVIRYIIKFIGFTGSWKIIDPLMCQHRFFEINTLASWISSTHNDHLIHLNWIDSKLCVKHGTDYYTTAADCVECGNTIKITCSYKKQKKDGKYIDVLGPWEPVILEKKQGKNTQCDSYQYQAI
jgi:hypothetical protein